MPNHPSDNRTGVHRLSDLYNCSSVNNNNNRKNKYKKQQRVRILKLFLLYFKIDILKMYFVRQLFIFGFARVLVIHFLSTNALVIFNEIDNIIFLKLCPGTYLPILYITRALFMYNAYFFCVVSEAQVYLLSDLQQHNIIQIFIVLLIFY